MHVTLIKPHMRVNMSNFNCKIEFKYYAILIYTIGSRKRKCRRIRRIKNKHHLMNYLIA